MRGCMNHKFDAKLFLPSKQHTLDRNSMAVWKYAALSQEEAQQAGGGLPETVPAMGGGPASYAEDDVALKRRMPFCIGL